MTKIQYMVLGILALLAIEDYRCCAVTLWKLVVFGGMCIVKGIMTGRFVQASEINLLFGILFSITVLVICVLTDRMGAADVVVIVFLGMAVGGVPMIRIIFVTFFIMTICSVPLFLTGKADMKLEMPMIPFIFLAAFWEMM